MAVTNFDDANIAVFQLTSGGAAYTITLPFQADTIEWWNATEWATASKKVGGIWINGMASAAALLINTNATPVLDSAIGSASITYDGDGTGFAATQRIPTAITADATATVTSDGHGLLAGQFVRATMFVSTPVADATGMYVLNNQVFQVGNPTTNTFQLFIPYTNVPINLTGQTAFVSNGIAQFNLVGQNLYTQNPVPLYNYLLGTDVMGASNDVIYIRAMKANQYTPLGVV